MCHIPLFLVLSAALNINIQLHFTDEETEARVHTQAPGGPGFKQRHVFYHLRAQRRPRWREGSRLLCSVCPTWSGTKPAWGFPGTFLPESPERPFHPILSPRWDLRGLHYGGGKGTEPLSFNGTQVCFENVITPLRGLEVVEAAPAPARGSVPSPGQAGAPGGWLPPEGPDSSAALLLSPADI